jgi:hypothetical protein
VKFRLPDNVLSEFESISNNYGFKEFKTTSETIKGGKKISTTKTTIGLYTDENYYYVFLHHALNENLIGNIKNQLSTILEVDHFYEGQSYLFMELGRKSYAFNVTFYKNIKDVIAEINLKTPFEIKQHMISSDGRLACLLMNDNSRFCIAGVIGFNEYAEEERINLVRRIESAQPFFNFEPYRKVDWSKIKNPTGTHFESLCEKILSKQNNIIDIQPVGKANAADRGRDFIVKEKGLLLDGKSTEVKWLVQCKYSISSISTKTLPDWTNRVIEHHVDGFWIMTNNDLTPDLFDQLKESETNKKIQISTRIWQRNKFDALYNTHPELFTEDDFM